MAKKLFSLTPAQDNLLVPKTTTSNLTTDNKIPKSRGLRNSNIITSASSTLGITNTNCTLVSGDTTINVCSDKCVNVFVTENISEQKYIKNIEGSGSLCVGTVNTSNVYTNIINSVCKLGFDTDSGFEVTDLGSGLAKIGMNSTFKYWEVDGNPGLTACGLDTVNFIAGSGVTITSDNNAVPKSLTISATGTSSGVSSLNSLTGALTLSAGTNTAIGVSGSILTLCNTYTGVTGINSLAGGVTLSAGTNVTIGSSGNTLTICSSGGGIPGGCNTQVQFNDSGTFGGNTGFTYCSATCTVGMQNITPPSGALTVNLPNGKSSWYDIYYWNDGSKLIYGMFIASDANGNSYVYGHDNANGIPYLVKYDKNGSLLWQKAFNDPSNFYKVPGTISIDKNTGSTYLTIDYDDVTNNSVNLIKVNSSGDIVWKKQISVGLNRLFSLASAIDSSNNVYLTINNQDAICNYIVKFDSDGNLIWQKQINNSEFTYSMTVDGSGNIYTVSQSESANSSMDLFKYDNTGSLILQKSFTTFGTEIYYNVFITSDNSGNLYINGQTFNTGSWQPFVFKTDNLGNILWQRNFVTNATRGFQIKIDDLGNSYLAGESTVDDNIGSITKLDNSGSVVWQRNLQFLGMSFFLDSYWGNDIPLTLYEDHYVFSVGGLGNYGRSWFTTKMPVDGSLVGQYGDFVYSETSPTSTTTQFTSGSISYTVTTPSITVATSTVTNNNVAYFNFLYTIVPENRSYQFASDGTFDSPAGKLTIQSGGAGQVLCNDGSGNIVWSNSRLFVDTNNSTMIENFLYQSPVAQNIKGYNNVGIGDHALYCNRGSNNFAAGSYAMGTNSTGNANIAIGNIALYCNTTGYGNIGLGYQALYSNSSGNCNIGLGRSALLVNTTGINNIGIGSNSLRCNTTGFVNIGVGCNAGGGITFGAGNIAIGYSSMFSVQTGNLFDNVAIGSQSQYCQVNGSHNIGLGYNSARCHRIGSSNIAIGDQAQESNICGSENISIGSRALFNTLTGIRNVAIGIVPLYNNINGSDNVSIGALSLYCNTVGNYNVALGINALYNNTTPSEQVAIGVSSLYCNTTGTTNIAIGSNSLYSNTIGSGNTTIGYYSLYTNSLGCNNTALGRDAGKSNTTGNNNTFVGYNAGCNLTTGSNNTIIGSLTGSAGLVCTVLIGAGTCERIRVDNNGLCINGTLFTGGGVSSINTLTGAVTLSAGTNVTIGSSGSTLTICSSGGSPSLDAYCSFDVGDGLSTSTGLNNIAIGCCTMFANTTGNNNIGFGFQALQCNTNGITNFAAGRMALRFNTGGGANTAIGPLALYGNKTGNDNIAIGSDALRCNQSGYGNVALGKEANLYGCSNNNIALGHMALRDNNDGNGNIAMGCCAMKASEGGLFNLAIGCKTLANNGASCHHVAIGSLALSSNSTGQSNIAIGSNALTANTVGSLNIGIGCLSGCSITTGNNNTIIGTLAGSAGLVCTVLIAAGTCERIKVDDNGLCINGSPFSGGSGVTSVATSGSGLGFSLGGGPITTTGTVSLTIPSASDLSTCLQGDGLSGTSVGYRVLPQNSQSTNYTLVAADSGKHLLHPSSDANARTFTIPANSSVAYPIGTSITFINETSQALTISITSDTMYLAGSGLTGSRTLSQYGVATAIKTGSTTWYISGTGLT